MSLRNKIDEDYKQSIKNKDQQKIDTLRLIRSAIKDKDISSFDFDLDHELLHLPRGGGGKCGNLLLLFYVVHIINLNFYLISFFK